MFRGNTMSTERTLSIIKPDAVSKNVIGEIISRFEKGGLRIAAAKFMHLTKQQAEHFYAVHKERPFFAGLVSFMSSGPVLVQVLEGENAIAKNRQIMGEPILKMQLLALFVLILQIQLITMLFTGQMLQKRLNKKLLFSFNQKKSVLM